MTALGVCVCGYPSWTLTAGQPAHPCCVVNGPDCEPCRISRDSAKKRTPRQRNAA